jgi:hypothetical protein
MPTVAVWPTFGAIASDPPAAWYTLAAGVPCTSTTSSPICARPDDS